MKEVMKYATPILSLFHMHTILEQTCKHEKNGNVIEIKCPGVRMIIEIDDELNRILNRLPPILRKIYLHAVIYTLPW